MVNLRSYGIRFPANFWRGVASYVDHLPSRMHVELRAELMLEAYRRRRERYAAAAARAGLSYDATMVGRATAERLRSSGLRVTTRPANEPVHTLAFIPVLSWHHQLLPPLRELGPVSHFDYQENGVKVTSLLRMDEQAVPGRLKACEAFERYAAEVAAERPVDWIFVYANGMEILAATLDRVREITGAPVVTMCFDDKQSWEGPPLGGQRSGQIDIGKHFDLVWTSARIACEWYMVEGGNPVFLGEGCSPEIFRPGSASPDLDVGFVGQAYGYRREFVRRLQSAGLTVHAAGSGWPGGSVAEAEMLTLMQRSKVILGLGGIGWSEQLKNVKGRDFDAPCVGTYLTSYNPDLTPSFEIGREILCYSNVDEAVEQARQLVSDSALRRRLARRGRDRCVAEHTWLTRYRSILTYLGIYDEAKSAEWPRDER
jgi:hypothetical protein